MPPALNIEPEELDSPEKRGKFTVSIVGCGQRGVLLAKSFAEAGFKVLCTDANQGLVKKLIRGKTVFAEPQIEAQLKKLIGAGQITVSSERKKAILQSDVIIVAVSAKVDDKKKTDLSGVLAACKEVGAAMRQGMLVVYAGAASLGFTEGAFKETLEDTSGLKVGQDFALAYNPIVNGEVLVAADDEASLKAAANIYATITANVHRVSSVKTAETAALLALSIADANKALAGELAVFCEKANVDFFQAAKLLDAKTAISAPSVLEEEKSVNAYLLLENAENLNAKLRLPVLARQINEDMAKHAVNLISDALRSCDKTLRRARIAVLGGAQSTAGFVKMLELRGAKVNVYDSSPRKEPAETRNVKSSLNEAAEGADCIVILTALEQFKHLNLKKIKPLMKTHSAIVDLTGVFEPQQAQSEGFIYRGLGRGAV
jgi:nucleotide sugar dehydrogenase